MKRLLLVGSCVLALGSTAYADGFIGINGFSGGENLIDFNTTDMTLLSHPTANIGMGVLVTDSGGGTGSPGWRGNTDWSTYFDNIPGSSQGRALADSWGASDLLYDFTGAGNPNRAGLLLSTGTQTTWTVEVYDPAFSLLATTTVTMPGPSDAVFVGYEASGGIGYLRLIDVENGFITIMDDLRFENISGCIIDQNQPSGPVYMAGFAQTDLAQSFQHQLSNNICGAGIFLQPGIGSTDNVTIELWTTLPNGGGQMLATASAQGTQGQWVDVFWNPVPVTANTTYYLNFTGNSTLGIAGDTNDPYPFGQVYANPGYQPFPSFDYTFRTYSTPGGLTLTLSGTCPGTVTVAWSGATPSSTMGIVYGANQGSTTIPGGPCAGTVLGLQGQVRLVNTIGTGSGSGQVNGRAGSGACGNYLQLVVVDNSPCTISNVAQIP